MSARFGNRLSSALFCLSALCAGPALAQNSAKPVVATGQPLSQALTALSTADGFEIRGLDKVGDEVVPAPRSEAPIQALRHMLGGYAYTLELAPTDPAAKAQGDKAGSKLVRVSILGRVGDVAGDPASTTQPAAVSVAEGGTAPAPTTSGASQEAPVHPVTHMLQSIALSSMPRPAGSAQAQLAVSGQAVPAATAASSATGSDTSGNTATPAAGTADMAALTQSASANLSALVQSLKAACPAGSKC